MRTPADGPPAPEDLAHGLQSPAELPREVSSWCGCLWPTDGRAARNVATVGAKLPRSLVARLDFERRDAAASGFPCSALLCVAPHSRASAACWVVCSELETLQLR